MQGAALTTISEIKEGDEIVNIGIVEKVEHAPVAKISCFTITKGKCLSAAFYWYHSEAKLWTIKANNTMLINKPPTHPNPEPPI